MTIQTLNDLQLHNIQQAIKLLGEYEMSEECYCERMRKAPSRYGHPPCLKCRTRQILVNVEDIKPQSTDSGIADYPRGITATYTHRRNTN